VAGIAGRAIMSKLPSNNQSFRQRDRLEKHEAKRRARLARRQAKRRRRGAAVLAAVVEARADVAVRG
jgi:hypothetical protein